MSVYGSISRNSQKKTKTPDRSTLLTHVTNKVLNMVIIKIPDILLRPVATLEEPVQTNLDLAQMNAQIVLSIYRTSSSI